MIAGRAHGQKAVWLFAAIALKLSAEVEPSRSPVILSSANMHRRSVEGEARVGRSAESSPSQIKPCEPEGAKLVPVRTRRAMFGEVSMSGP